MTVDKIAWRLGAAARAPFSLPRRKRAARELWRGAFSHRHSDAPVAESTGDGRASRTLRRGQARERPGSAARQPDSRARGERGRRCSWSFGAAREIVPRWLRAEPVVGAGRPRHVRPTPVHAQAGPRGARSSHRRRAALPRIGRAHAGGLATARLHYLRINHIGTASTMGSSWRSSHAAADQVEAGRL